MADLDFAEHSHKRLNILTGDWVMVSPHRAKRPWQGRTEDQAEDHRPQYEPQCYLCPGNTRNSGITNPHYVQTFVFDNDFMALRPEVPPVKYNHRDLLVAEGEPGICRVICFSNRHDLTLAEMAPAKIREVIEEWIHQYQDLGSRENIGYVQIFENKGEIMGCSNPHPHGQIWAENRMPTEVAKKDEHQKHHFAETGRSLLGDYLELEQELQERIIYENATFVVVVPFWAIWPFEAMVAPKRQVPNLEGLRTNEKEDYADALKRLTVRYDNLFEVSFPYSAGIHQAPTDGQETGHWHMHHVFYPPLLRSATVKKFMVGYEMLGMPQRDITAEIAAQRLRDLPDKHYKE